MKSGNIGIAHHLCDRAAELVIANSGEQSFVVADIQFGLLSKKGCQAGLRIEIDGQGAIAMERQKLRQVCGSGCLAAATLEIHHGDDLQMLPFPAVRDVAAVAPCALVELLANVGNVVHGIATPVAFRGLAAFGPKLAQIAFSYSQQLCRLGRAEVSNGFFGLGREDFTVVGPQLAREQVAVRLNKRFKCTGAFRSSLFLRHISNISLHTKLRQKPQFRQNTAVTVSYDFDGVGKAYWVNRALTPGKGS